MTGIVLKAVGLDVHIYERSPRVLDDRGAGIVMQAETEIFLTQDAGLRSEQTGVMLKYRQYLNSRPGRTSDGARQSTSAGRRRIYSPPTHGCQHRQGRGERIGSRARLRGISR
jgi:2-polyprenyl-6-methoxyphenol hydroxylase-like FAD-dependent oxidoreductase